MQTTWRNLYKNAELFFCPHRLHKHHESGTSAWHILKNKQCYPHGCVSFAWKCKKFDEGHKCPRGKKHVGKDCFSCPFFYDLKNSFQPELKASEEEYSEFQRQFAEFEEWLEQLKSKRIEVRGRIHSINPLLVNHGENGSLRISCNGILLYFKEGIFQYDRFLDPFYANLSFRTYDHAKVAVGDEIDMLGKLEISRGRFVFDHVGSIDIIRSDDRPPIPASHLKQMKFTGTLIEGQPAKCLRCPNGLLIDSVNGDGRSAPRRIMYCTKGVADYRFCPYNV